MPLNVWVQVVFTWSAELQARLYLSGYLANAATEETTLINVRGGNNNSPITVTLGHYNGTANCQGIAQTNLSAGFMGSIDELYIFKRELQKNEINDIITVYAT